MDNFISQSSTFCSMRNIKQLSYFLTNFQTISALIYLPFLSFKPFCEKAPEILVQMSSSFVRGEKINSIIQCPLEQYILSSLFAVKRRHPLPSSPPAFNTHFYPCLRPYHLYIDASSLYPWKKSISFNTIHCCLTFLPISLPSNYLLTTPPVYVSFEIKRHIKCLH